MPNPFVVLATAGYDHTIRFWEATRGVCYRTLQHQDSQVNKLEISPDKQILAAAGNPTIKIFEVNASNPSPIVTHEGHQGNVTAIGFERDGRWMYSGSDDGTVKLWDARQGSRHTREYESRAAVTTVAPAGAEAAATAAALAWCRSTRLGTRAASARAPFGCAFVLAMAPCNPWSRGGTPPQRRARAA